MNSSISRISFILVLFSNILLESSVDHAKKWQQFKETAGTQKNSTIVDKNEFMRAYEDEFYKVMLNYSMSAQQRNMVFALKCTCRTNIEERINGQFYSDKASMERDAADHRSNCIAEMARAKTAYICQQAGVNPKIQERLEQEAYDTAKSIVARRISGGLAYLVDGTLETKLQTRITELSRKKEIYEIYPHEKGPHRQETLNNISNGKHFRDTECCICQEAFQEIGKRVNLPYGHDICPACLYQTKYRYNNNACPKCRRPISEQDFPAFYLKGYIGT